MIKYIRFNNFYSYLDETEVSFELSKQATVSAYDFTVKTTQDNIRLNKIMAVVGANGSGKTQFLKPLSFLTWYICTSAKTFDSDKQIVIQTHILSEPEDATFHMGFLLKNLENNFEEYRYELVINREQIVKENLYKKSSSQFSYIFKRSYVNGVLEYRHNGFIRPSLANDAQKNVSLISYAEIFENEIAKQIINSLMNNESNVVAGGRLSQNANSIVKATKLFNENEKLKKTAEDLLCKFDTGIQEIVIKEITALAKDSSETQEILLPFGIHRTIDGKTFELNFFQESNGTQSAFNLLSLILPVLQNGGIAIIDELDNDLHPHLLQEIFNLFRSEYTNPHNAQLIFTCHTPEVFNILNKHQIYLVEKIDQKSEAWRLDEVEGIRNDDNLYAKYMAGAFSAVPNL